MTDNLFWRNRITESGAADPQELAKGMNPLNWRGHPESQREALEEALESIGFLQRVLVNKSSGRVIDGHLRIELAILKGQPLIPVDYVELSDDEEALALATLDAITEQAEPIPDKLAQLLERTRELTAEKPGLAAMMERLRLKAGLAGNGNGKGQDAEPQVDRAKELQEVWGVQLGDVWELPSLVEGRPHRIICGDCTDKTVVEAVMRGERARGVITDSPYGINREGIENDSPEGLRQLFYDSIRAIPADNAVIINFQSPRLFPAWIDALVSAGGKFERMLWMYDENKRPVKPWHYWLMCSQAIVVGSLGNPEWARCMAHHDTYHLGLAKEWRQGGAENDFAHSTVKPLPVVQDLMNHTIGLVYDPFLGSGTTLIAAHNLGRIARGIEIEPSYVAVTLQRYIDATSLRPHRLSG